MALTLRQLLEQVGVELDVSIAVTIDPGTQADRVLDHELWLVNHQPTPKPQAVIHDGIVYLTNRKEGEE